MINLIQIVSLILISSSILIASIIYHEFGHFMIHLINKRQPRFGFNKNAAFITFDFDPYNKNQLDAATAYGIIFGLFTFFLVKNIISFPVMVVLLILYLSCCRDDFLKLLGKKDDCVVKEYYL